MPNQLAYIALYLWPFVALILFRVYSRPRALVLTIISGYLLLPARVSINFPMLPTFDKDSVPAISAAIICMLLPRSSKALKAVGYAKRHSIAKPHVEAGDRESGLLRRGARKEVSRQVDAAARIPRLRLMIRIERALLFLLVVTPFVTVMRNGDPVFLSDRVFPGLRVYDGFSMALASVVAVLPYLLARRYLGRPEQHTLLLGILCIAGAIYSLPALLEIRLSPQISVWVYGFLGQPFQHSMRGDGFRPIVFLHGGLWLAIFLAMAFIAALARWRVEREHIVWLVLAGFTFGTLALSHSLGALGLAVLFLPVAILLKPRRQMFVASMLAGIILFYPALRGAGLIPVNTVSAIARTFSDERARSFEFRLRNEDILLARAQIKPLSGWGGYGRSRVFDPTTGKDISITDGAWIIVVGAFGWLGYVARFGLLIMPLFFLTLSPRRVDITLATSGLCLILLLNLIDMIPNNTLTSVTWLIAGALMGRVAGAHETGSSAEAATVPSGRIHHRRSPVTA